MKTILIFLSICRISSFLMKSSSINIYTRAGMTMVNDKIALIGTSGGVIESITSKLLEKGVEAQSILTQAPKSPLLSNKNNVFIGDFEKGSAVSASKSASVSDLLDGKIVIIADDNGDERLVGMKKEDGPSETDKMLNKVLSTLPKSIKSIICVSKVVDDSNKLNLFFRSQPSLAYKTWCEQNQIPFISLQYGKLIGGISGCEPTPFISMPLQDPEIDPSYVLRATVLNDVKTNKYANTEICTRESITQVITEMLDQNLVPTTKSSISSTNNDNNISKGMEALVISIVGQPLTSSEWKQLFNRMSNSDNTEIFKVTFKEIIKPQFFLNWITDTWFPQALIEADAATILTGGRPVRIINPDRSTKSPQDQKLKILWEDIQPDLTVKSVGYLEISLSMSSTGTSSSTSTSTSGGDNSSNNTSSSPSLIVKRMAKTNLPGESQLMDKLLEGINKNVYKKQFCIPIENVTVEKISSKKK